jgi:hypothetical protein
MLIVKMSNAALVYLSKLVNRRFKSNFFFFFFLNEINRAEKVLHNIDMKTGLSTVETEFVLIGNHFSV